MITISQITVGKGYLTRHLSANDYYSEGEKVVGQWFGKGADLLGLTGDVEEAAFEALRQNRQPSNGEKLTARKSKVAFHDITLSAPKSVSIAAVVGGDERLIEAFHQTVKTTLSEMERLAAVRDRTGKNVHTEATRRTGNIIAGVFHHDSSRTLDPQLHAHAVLANASYDASRESWFALQPIHMLEESKTKLRSLFYHDLAKRAQDLGYEVEWRGQAFRLKGVSEALDVRFSQRTVQRQAFERRYRATFGRAPSKRRVEQFIKEGRAAAVTRFQEEHRIAFGRTPSTNEIGEFVRDWRDPKLKRISTANVRKLQRERLSSDEVACLDATVAAARQGVGAIVESTAKDLRHRTSTLGERIKVTLGTAGRSLRQSAGEMAKQIAGNLKQLPNPSTNQLARERARISRTEMLRKLRHGRRVAQAMQGLPHGLAKHALRSQAVSAKRRLI